MKLLAFEAASQDVKFRQFSMKSSMIKKNSHYYQVTFPKPTNGMISIKDKLILKSVESDTTVEVEVLEVNGETVVFQQKYGGQIDCGFNYDIVIHAQMSSLDRCFAVLDEVKEKIGIWSTPPSEIRVSEQLRKFLDVEKLLRPEITFVKNLFGIIFPSIDDREKTSSGSGEEEFKFNRFDNELNEMQLRAVSNILAEKCKPAPYLLFGPRKSGKSKVIVEAVLQLYKMYPEKRILVCATTNSGADNLAHKIKLSGVSTRKDMIRDLVRVVGINRMERKLVPYNIRDISKTNSYLKQSYRIIVTTCLQSAVLNSCYSFDYIFIDEATRSIEPETLIPISLAHWETSFVVFAGDLKQPGPYVTSDIAKNSGLGVSMMERLSKFSMYQEEGEESEMKYDERYITKLTK